MGGAKWAKQLNRSCETKFIGDDRDRKKIKVDKIIKSRKHFANERRRQGMAERQLVHKSGEDNSPRACIHEIIVVMFNVRAIPLDGAHRVRRALDVLSV